MLLILGLDGASYNLLDPLVARGDLPNLARLMREGLRAELLSTTPPATLPAWTSFLTGAPPGHHGVTDIFVRPTGTYDLLPASGALRAVPTFLARLSERGRRVASFGVPGTFPPEPVRGVCVAGFDAPGVHRATRASVWPRSYWSELERSGGWRYATFNEHRVGATRLREAVRALTDDVARKERVLLEALRRGPWDVFFAHLQASDTAAHHLWHTFDARSPRYAGRALADALPSVYRRLDALIGTLLAAAPAETRVLVVSDHGMGGASTTAVHVNRALARVGLASFARRAPPLHRHLRRALGLLPPAMVGAAVRAMPRALVGGAMRALRGVALDLPRCDAFSDELDYAPSIWIHRAGRFPKGRVGAERVAAVRERAAEALVGLRTPHSGELVVKSVAPREATEQDGPFVERAPDLLIEPAWLGGYRVSFLPSHGPGEVVRTLAPHEHAAAKGSGLPGVHRREGVFVAHGPGIPVADLPPLHIAEAGAAVYALLDEPVPEDLRAQLPESLAALFPVGRAASPTTARAAPDFSAAERFAVNERLRRLGYLE